MCFGAAWLEQFLIWLVGVVLVILILGALVKYALPKSGWAAETIALIAKIIRWVIVALIVIVCIKILFDLYYCFVSFPRAR